jgi:hypothetical protein
VAPLFLGSPEFLAFELLVHVRRLSQKGLDPARLMDDRAATVALLPAISKGLKAYGDRFTAQPAE